MIARKEITEDEYKAINNSRGREQNDLIFQVAMKSDYHPFGYGCWNGRAIEESGKYYAVWDRLTSCD